MSNFKRNAAKVEKLWRRDAVELESDRMDNIPNISKKITFYPFPRIIGGGRFASFRCAFSLHRTGASPAARWEETFPETPGRKTNYRVMSGKKVTTHFDPEAN